MVCCTLLAGLDDWRRSIATIIVAGVIADARSGNSGNTVVTGGEDVRRGNTMTGVSVAAPPWAATDDPALVWMSPITNAAT